MCSCGGQQTQVKQNSLTPSLTYLALERDENREELSLVSDDHAVGDARKL